MNYLENPNLKTVRRALIEGGRLFLQTMADGELLKADKSYFYKVTKDLPNVKCRDYDGNSTEYGCFIDMRSKDVYIHYGYSFYETE